MQSGRELGHMSWSWSLRSSASLLFAVEKGTNLWRGSRLGCSSGDWAGLPGAKSPDWGRIVGDHHEDHSIQLQLKTCWRDFVSIRTYFDLRLVMIRGEYLIGWKEGKNSDLKSKSVSFDTCCYTVICKLWDDCCLGSRAIKITYRQRIQDKSLCEMYSNVNKGSLPYCKHGN